MNFLRAALIWLCLVSPAFAGMNHGLATMSGPTGHSWIQGTAITTSSAVNILKSLNLTYTAGATPGIWKPDANGYPTADCTATCTGVFKLTSASSQGVIPGVYYLYFPSGFKAKFTTGTSTLCSVVSGTAGSCSAATNATITIDGSGAGVLQFMLPDAQASFVWNATYNYSGSTGGMALVAAVNQTQYNTYVGTGDAREYYSAQFLTYLANLNPSGYRFYGDIGENVNQTLWAYRTPLTNIMWTVANQNYPPGAWSGGSGTSGAITRSAVATGCTPTGGSEEVYTAAATADQPSPNPLSLLTDPTMASRGLTVQGIIPVGAANTTTSPKLCWGTNAYPIWDPATGITVASGRIAAPASTSADQVLATFVFDPILNGGNGVFLYFGATSSGGISTELPYEAQIALVNYLNKNMATAIPYLAPDSYITSLATLVKTNLRSGLYWSPEYSNEVWNNAFYPTKYAFAVATAMGFSNDVQSWYSLRVRQIMGNVIPAVFTGADLTRLRRWLGYAGFQSSTVLTNNGYFVNRMKSAQLKSGATGSGPASVGQVFCVYTGGTWSGSCSGGADYTAQVSAGGSGRAIDVVEALVYAPYTGATNLFYGADNCSACVPTTSNVTFWQTIIDAHEAGSTSTANTIINGDIQQGRNFVQTVTASGSPTTFTTSTDHGLAVGANIGFEWTGGTPYANMAIGVQYCVKSTPSSVTFTVVIFSGGLSCNTSGTAFSAGAAGTGIVTVGYMGAMGVSSQRTISSTAGTTFTTSSAYTFVVGSLVTFQWTSGTGYSNMGATANIYCVKTTPSSTTFTVVAAIKGFYCDTAGTAFDPGTIGSAPAITISIASIGNTVSMMATNNSAHLWGQTLVAQFQSPNETRPAGMSNLRLDQYEGSLEPGVPTTAQCQVAGATSTNPVISFTGDLTATNNPFISNISDADIAKLMVGMTAITGTGYAGGTATLSSVFPDRNSIQVSANPSTTGTGISFTTVGNCGTSLNLAVFNYKKSVLFAATQKLYFDQFKGRDPNMPTYNVMLQQGDPSQLVMGGTSGNSNNSQVAGGNQYGLLNGAFFGTSETFQNYTGIQQFNAE